MPELFLYLPAGIVGYSVPNNPEDQNVYSRAPVSKDIGC